MKSKDWKDVRREMVASAIRDVRTRSGLSQTALGTHLKTTTTTVCRWERGEMLPGTEPRQTLSRMAMLQGHERSAFVLRLPDKAWSAIASMTPDEWAMATEIRKRNGQ